MNRQVPDTGGKDRTLRNRLLVRLALLLLVLATAVGAYGFEWTVSADAHYRILLAALLLASGFLLILSIINLVQTGLLNPLVEIRAWAAKLREGLHTDPIVAPPDRTFRELATDLNVIGKRMTATNDSRSTVTPRAADLEEDSLKILYDVVSSINTAHSLDDLLTRFMYTLKRITRAHGATIWVNHNQQQTELGASSGIDDDLLLPDRHEFRRCLYERAATEGKIWIEEDLAKCERIAGRRLFEQDGIGLVSVPMRYRGRVTGVINLFLDNGMLERIDSIRPLLTSVAYHISVAIERYYSEEENRAHLIREERIRIAHELHDSLAQTLASLRFQVRVLDETLHQGDESTTWQQLEWIENSLDEANTELRGLIANFRAPSYQRGLIETIEQIVSQFRNETGIRTYIQKDCSASAFTRDTETQILRIIQEALWNIRKHSQAKTVRILLRGANSEYCHILIEDDGIGINGQVYGSPGEHVGLTIMRERASKIGGDLRIESEPGEGTRVILEIRNPAAGNRSG
ncbi:MAG: histidine kinase [Gammaproteobacteria bacterium]|jgi:two-component system nitrate/nitrite sensor histidine kinase NarX